MTTDNKKTQENLDSKSETVIIDKRGVRRNARGQVLPGSTANPDGRRKKANEQARLEIMKEVVSEEDWRRMCQMRKMEAFGLKPVTDANGKVTGVIADTNSTVRSRLSVTQFFADYLIGRPITPVIMAKDDGTVTDAYKAALDKFEEMTGETINSEEVFDDIARTAYDAYEKKIKDNLKAQRKAKAE